jgi:hypothetical protein
LNRKLFFHQDTDSLGDGDIFFGATMYHVGGRNWGFDDAALTHETQVTRVSTGMKSEQGEGPVHLS